MTERSRKEGSGVSCDCSPIYIPKRKKPGRTRPSDGDLESVQFFVKPELKKRFNEWVERRNISSMTEALRWLISYAVKENLKPPAEE
ncbi:MAG: hypothetical protein IMY86_13850 [Chloroflexi bacterium]|nr:hypothetical protein [Chloroflexota bacterium]